jgi:hypothetical protein
MKIVRAQSAHVFAVGVRLTGAEFWPSLGRFEDYPQFAAAALPEAMKRPNNVPAVKLRASFGGV